MRSLWVLNVKKLAYEMSGPVAKVEAPQAGNDSINPHGKFYRNVFLA